MEMILAVGIGIGLASVAGVRAFLPLTLAALFGVFGLFSLPPFVAVGEWVYVGVFAALAVVEVALDKLSSLERVFNIVMVPVRAAAGALLLGAAFGAGIDGPLVPLVAGGAVAGIVAALKVVLRPPAGVASSGVSASFLSLIEDAVGLVGGLIGLFVPYLPVLLVAFLLFFYARIRRRRGRKFGGLRILGD